MQCNVRQISVIVDKVKDIVVTRDGIMSPFAKHSIFANDREWDTILDFVQYGGGSLEKGTLAYFCQNVHLQRPFRDATTTFHFEGFDKDERKDVLACFTYVRDQLAPLDDFDAAFGFANVHEQGFREDAKRFFDMCQPCFGKDQALTITHAWFNKRLYKSEYDESIERLLKSFPAIE